MLVIYGKSYNQLGKIITENVQKELFIVIQYAKMTAESLMAFFLTYAESKSKN